MDDDSEMVARWVAREILPYEKSVRLSVQSRWRGAVDVDDVLQEAYCRVSTLTSVAHIENPLAYFRRTAHAAAVDAFRQRARKNVVTMTESEWVDVIDREPLADRRIEAAQELDRLNHILQEMSDTCRSVIYLRRVEGLSQRETAERLGVSENIIENHISRGLKKVLRRLAGQDAELDARMEESDGARPEDAKVVRIGKPRHP